MQPLPMHVDAREENYLVVGSQQHCHCVALQGAGLQIGPLWDSRGSFYLIKSVTTMLVFTLKSVDLSLGVISLSRLETELGVLLTLRCQSPVGLILGSRRKTRRLCLVYRRCERSCSNKIVGCAENNLFSTDLLIESFMSSGSICAFVIY